MARFRYFVIFAEMRTGSNFLEASLNQFEDLSVYGEAFNALFVGHHNKDALFGFDLQKREADPLGLIKSMIAETEGLPGFRFFNDHDPRVKAHVLSDPSCAKIVLTRNPLDSYVSLKIASATDQWKLSDLKQHRGTTVRYDDAEFREHLAAKQEFQLEILSGLQRTGQTAFYISYEDIQDVEILNGLARWLGSEAQISSVSKSTKKQNPSRLEEKVENYDEMRKQLSSLDHFALNRTPNFEPRRGPGVRNYVVSEDAPLLFIPIPGGPNESVVEWMSGLGSSGIQTGLSQKELRQWKRQNRNHRSFAVLRHPLDRAYSVFCRHIFQKGDENFREIRPILRNRYGVQLPNKNELSTYSVDDHRAAFSNFLKFLKGNLAEQTSVRIDAVWASQSALLEGACRVVVPDVAIREETAQAELTTLAERYGLEPGSLPFHLADAPFSLADIYTAELEKLCFAAYRKDYINFGFEDWSG